MNASESPPPPVPGAATENTRVTDVPWGRLDPRMLLIHPCEELVRFLPVVVGGIVLGTNNGNPIWGAAAVAAVILLGITRYFTTTYRVGPIHVELRRGVLVRQELSVPRSRIRSVDVDRKVLHRLLGLACLRLGTGQATGPGQARNRFELNGIPMSEVPALRAALLAAVPTSDDGATSSAPGSAPDRREIARLDTGWVRYAPFSTTGLLAVAAFVGLVFQAGLGESLVRSSTVERASDAFTAAGPFLAVAVTVTAVLVVSSVLACARYLLVYGNLRVTDDGRTLRVGHGLLRIRHATLDRARLRGVDIRVPLALRIAGGARLDAIMTGVAHGNGEASLVLPSAPAGYVHRAAGDVLTAADPVRVPLIPHGPAARRRRYTRVLVPVTVVVAAAVTAATLLDVAPPISVTVGITVAVFVAGSALAWDRYRGLGHAVTAGFLVTGRGSVDRRRVCLEADGIIGWTVRQTFFQRRAGVATVVAATPAGTGHYEVVDIPVEQAWALVEAVTPGAGDVWVRR